MITEHLERRKNERVFKTNFLAISCFQSYLTFLGNVACQSSSRGGQTTAQFNLCFERGSNPVFSQNVHCFYHYHWDSLISSPDTISTMSEMVSKYSSINFIRIKTGRIAWKEFFSVRLIKPKVTRNNFYWNLKENLENTPPVKTRSLYLS